LETICETPMYVAISTITKPFYKSLKCLGGKCFAIPSS